MRGVCDSVFVLSTPSEAGATVEWWGGEEWERGPDTLLHATLSIIPSAQGGGRFISSYSVTTNRARRLSAQCTENFKASFLVLTSLLAQQPQADPPRLFSPELK